MFDIVIYFDDTFPSSKKDFDIQNILRQHKIFQSHDLLPKTSLTCESELVVLSLLKDRVYQLYCRHILDSNIINNTKERLRQKDFISEATSDIEAYEIWIKLMETIADFSKWLTRFTRELPGFNEVYILISFAFKLVLILI